MQRLEITPDIRADLIAALHDLALDATLARTTRLVVAFQRLWESDVWYHEPTALFAFADGQALSLEAQEVLDYALGAAARRDSAEHVAAEYEAYQQKRNAWAAYQSARAAAD
jgi:hypothetical protein